MIQFIGPAGIGDLSWLYSKLHDLGATKDIGLAYSDGHPRRSQPLVRLLPNVKDLGYTSWNNYPRRAISWDTDLASLGDGEYYIQVNTGLEKGQRLETMFPNQRTEFHYPLNIPKESKSEAKKVLSSIQGSHKIGLYASAHYNEQIWMLSEWKEFISMIRDEYPDAAFYLIGATWDNLTYDLYKVLKEEKWNVCGLVGSQDLSVTLEVIKGLDYFFSYPSGLGIMADVLNTPNMMWIWKDIHPELVGTFSCPDNLATGRTISLLSTSVLSSYKRFMEKGAPFLAK